MVRACGPGMCCCLLIFIYACCAFSTARSDDCIDYAEYLKLASATGNVDGRGMSVVGEHVFLAAGEAGLEIFDVGNPKDPLHVAALEVGGIAEDVCVIDGQALVCAGYGGLRIVDIGDLSAPMETGAYYHMYIQGVDAVGNLAFVVDGRYLDVVNISDPSAPVQVSSMVIPGTPRDVWIVGDLAYVASDARGMVIVDVSEPAEPEIVGEYVTDGGTRGLAVLDDLAYVATGELHVVDVSNPTAPVLLNSIDPGMYLSHVTVREDRLLAAAGSDLCVVDISTRTDPVLVGAIGVVGYSRAIQADDRCVYLTGASGLVVLDDPYAPVPELVGALDTQEGALGVAVSGDIACVANGFRGLRVIDVSDPGAPVETSALPVDGFTSGVAVIGDRAYVASYFFGMCIAAVGSVSPPVFLAGIPMDGYPQAVEVQGKLAYVCNGYGLRIVNVAIPEAPELLGAVDTPGHSLSLCVEGRYAYIADLDGVQVIDVSSPWRPELARHAGVGRTIRDVLIGEEVLYACGPDGLAVFDVSNPGAPQLVAEPRPSLAASSLALAGNHLYVGGGSVFVYDISSSLDPVFVGQQDLAEGWAQDLVATNGYAWSASNTAGLQVARLQCSAFVPVIGEAPAATARMDLYPNPFNPRITVEFQIERDGYVDLGVYDLRGKKVATLESGIRSRGRIRSEWTGVDHHGNSVSSGNYMVRLKTDSGVQSSKITLVR